MNPIFRFVYWNMNYHVEHHMFPMVPYHRLPDLHEVMKADTPRPYASTIEAYREIIPAILRQRKEPEWYVKRELPPSAKPYRPELHGQVIVTAAE
jgi:fatty acid desaturase